MCLCVCVCVCVCFCVCVCVSGGGGEGIKRPPTIFYLVTSTNVGKSLQNFLTFSFNPFTTLLQNLKSVPSASPKLLNLNRDNRSYPYKIEVMITSLIEMLVTKQYLQYNLNHVIKFR